MCAVCVGMREGFKLRKTYSHRHGRILYYGARLSCPHETSTVENRLLIVGRGRWPG